MKKVNVNDEYVLVLQTIESRKLKLLKKNMVKMTLIKKRMNE